MLCNSCCLQSTLCLWLWLVLTFGYVLLYNNCPYSRHNVLLLLNILYHHYWASQLPHLQTECAIVLQSTGHTHVYAYTCAHTHHTHIHSHVITYLTTHSLQCWRFADSCSLLTGCQWMAPRGEQPSQQQAVGGLDNWRLWCLLGKHGDSTHQEHIHWGTPSLQWVIVVPSGHTHSVCTPANDVAMDSVTITSFLWEPTHTHFPLCCMFLCVSQS